MRSVLLVGWLLLPVSFAAWHYGPGQDRLLLDDIDHVLRQADAEAAEGNAAAAVKLYTEALAMLPGERTAEAQRIRVERAKAQLLSRQLPQAHDDLVLLVHEMSSDKEAKAEVLNDARSALANAKYYLTWLMRLEGLPREQWEPEIEVSRQNYRLLAEQCQAAGDETGAARHREDLESAIRLARMEPGELQGMPLPKQCQGCSSGQCKGKKPGKKPGKNSEKKDARGASSGPPPDDGGN